MFGGAPADAFPPESETGRFQFPAHETNDFLLGETGFFLDDLEGNTVLPGHADNVAGASGR